MLARGLVALALCIATCTPVDAFTIEDMRGRTVTLPAAPQRIISLVPSVTELIFALGGQERLAGRTDYCDWPPEARRTPSVGGMIAPSLETVVALKPDRKSVV